jgi:hypothetical protein
MTEIIHETMTEIISDVFLVARGSGDSSGSPPSLEGEQREDVHR